MKIGRYEVVRKLAIGGMAEVFLVKAAGPMSFEKTLVLKRILPHLASEPSFVEMFLSEAKLVAQLNHSNIVQIFDFGETEGSYFLTMEYVDGPNLRTLLKLASAQGTALSPTVCAKIIAAACEGLAYAHGFRDATTGEPLGLIHRDISPDNILLSRQGAVKVADFGIAKTAGRGHQTKEGVLKGKLSYIAPEQFHSRQPDRRVDVYALGVVLYELLTSSKPFDAQTDTRLIKSILFEPLIPAAERRQGLPESLLRILDRALAKDPDERYADCLAFQSDLDRFVLSTGEAMGSLQIAQLITQFDQPLPGGPSTIGAARVPAHPPVDAVVASREEPTVPTDALRAIRQGETVDLKKPKLPAVEPKPPEPQRSAFVADEAAQFEKALLTRRRKQVAVSAMALLLFASGGGYVLWDRETPAPLKPLNDAPMVEAFDAGIAAEDAGSASVNAEEAIAPEHPAPPLPLPADAGTPSPDAGPRSPPVRRKPSAPAASPDKQGAPSKIFVEFRIVPFATVSVDGKELGTTPFEAVELLEGHHKVRLVCANSPPEDFEFNVSEENKVFRHKHTKHKEK